MTAATLRTAPAEADIRNAVEAQWTDWIDHYSVASAPFVIDNIIDGVGAPLIASAAWTLANQAASEWEPYDPPQGARDGLWRDLRPSEAIRLMELVKAAQARALARCREAIIGELVAAGEAFAREFPDAPGADLGAPA